MLAQSPDEQTVNTEQDSTPDWYEMSMHSARRMIMNLSGAKNRRCPSAFDSQEISVLPFENRVGRDANFLGTLSSRPVVSPQTTGMPLNNNE